MFTLHDILDRAGIAPGETNVMLHSPREGDLLRFLPSLVRTRRAAMETYQASHSVNAERALLGGRAWVASFVKTGAGRERGSSAMLFAGLYRNHGGRKLPRAEIEANPEVRWLRETFGGYHELDNPDRTHWTWFDLVLDDRLTELQGRLVIEARLTQSYVRLAENLVAPVLAIHEASVFDAPAPDWRNMLLRAGMLCALPQTWRVKLQEWRGIYLIVDETDGQRYVGAAYGTENLLGRWLAHVAGAVGITAQLAARDSRDFRFSILERVSPDMPSDEVIRLERTWMERLHTVTHGLNS